MSTTPFDQIHQIGLAINHAQTAPDAASIVAQWLGRRIGNTAIAVLSPERTSAQVQTTDGYSLPEALNNWMRSPDAWLQWQSWDVPRWTPAGEAVEKLPVNGPVLIIPLRYETSTLGVLWLSGEGRSQSIETAGGHFAILLAQLLAARLHHLEVSRGWNTLVTNMDDFSRALSLKSVDEDIWELVREQIDVLFDATSFFVGLYDPVARQLRLPVVMEDDIPQYLNSLPLIGVSKAVISQGASLFFHDTDAERERLESLGIQMSELEPGWGARSWIGVPLRNRVNEVIGLASIQSVLPNHFHDSDLALLRLVAGQLSQVIESRQLLLAERNRRQLTSTLMEVNQALGSTLAYEEVLERILEQLQRLINYDRASIMLPSPNVTDGSRMIVSASQGQNAVVKGQEVYFSENSTGRQVYLSRQPLVVGDMQESPRTLPRTGQLSQNWTRAWLGVPMLNQEQVTGMIVLEKFEPNCYDEHHASTAFALARQAAIAVENARLHEKSLEANRLKNQFLANMSHELRTPLNAIIGYSELLISQVYGELNAKQFDRVSRVVSGGKHLLEMINGVLDLSRIEAGQMNLTLTSLDIGDVVYNAIADITPQVEAKGLTLTVNLQPGLPQIQADPQRLRQVITNLLDNAIKFTAEGSVTLEATITIIKDGQTVMGPTPPHTLNLHDGRWLSVAITDTGIGIDKADQEFIFEAFRQVDSSSVRKYEGSGLGLAITRQLAKLHQGDIWVESELDKGSTFTVILPASQLAEFQIQTDVSPSQVEQPVVMVVGDDPGALQLIHDYLSEDGRYQVYGATNPQQAIDIAHRLSPDVIIADVLTPTMTGWDLLGELKKDQQTATIPVIMLSASESEANDFQQKPTAFISKPIKREALLGTLRQLVLPAPEAPILIVDDDPNSRTIFEKILKKAGYTVAQVASGEEALNWLTVNVPSLILLDLMLPGISGAEVVEHLRNTPSLSHIQIVIITGSDITSASITELRGRVAEVMQKGDVSGNTLIERVKSALHR